MTRLDSIATRQRKSRLRDVFFAACVTVAAVVSVTSLGAACHAAAGQAAPVVSAHLQR